MPQRTRQLKTRLAIPVGALTMVQTDTQLYDAALKHNWRLQPIQFVLLAPSHTLADLIRAAGFEAVLYRSTKGSDKWLAVFPDLLACGSFIELSDQPPTAQTHLRLDDNSADELAGWDTLPPQLRSP